MNKKQVPFSPHPHPIQILKNMKYYQSNVEQFETIFLSYTSVWTQTDLSIHLYATNKHGVNMKNILILLNKIHTIWTGMEHYDETHFSVSVNSVIL